MGNRSDADQRCPRRAVNNALEGPDPAYLVDGTARASSAHALSQRELGTKLTRAFQAPVSIASRCGPRGASTIV